MTCLLRSETPDGAHLSPPFEDSGLHPAGGAEDPRLHHALLLVEHAISDSFGRLNARPMRRTRLSHFSRRFSAACLACFDKEVFEDIEVPAFQFDRDLIQVRDMRIAHLMRSFLHYMQPEDVLDPNWSLTLIAHCFRHQLGVDELWRRLRRGEPVYQFFNEWGIIQEFTSGWP